MHRKSGSHGATKGGGAIAWADNFAWVLHACMANGTYENSLVSTIPFWHVSCLHCDRIETVAWEPRAFVYHNFLTDAEADHLMKLGSQRVRRMGRREVYQQNT